MTERRTTGDLDPDTTVHIVKSHVTSRRVAHVDGDCRNVTENHDAKDAQVLWNDTSVCKECDPEIDGGEGKPNGPNKRRSLKNMISTGEVEI